MRFALALNKKSSLIEYEKPNGIGKSSIDFKEKINNQNCLFELTSLRESRNIKDATTTDGHFYNFQSDSQDQGNSIEVLELVKVQNAIITKADKFPKINKDNIHCIIVDMRSFFLGLGDGYDFYNIAFGSNQLINVDWGVNCRWWEDEHGERTLFIGLFEDSHPNPKSNKVRENIDILGFINEEKYKMEEIDQEIKLFCNPHTNNERYKDLF